MKFGSPGVLVASTFCFGATPKGVLHSGIAPGVPEIEPG